MLEIQRLTAVYEEKEILRNINISVKEDEVVALIGPSGTGKSTLLNCITGLHTPVDGIVKLGGKKLSPKNAKISWIPQHYGLLPWETVYKNIIMGLKIKKIPFERKNVMNLIDRMGLMDLLDKFPSQLSGGQQQRVSIARSMVMSPDVFLLDEPFSALDAMTREAMQCLFLEQWQIHRAPTIVITHDVEEAVFLGSRIVLLSGTPGEITEDISNELFQFSIDERRQTTEFYTMTQQVREALGR
ncbi:ABC transporter ATP-binding protein [Vagococcus vulneris]|uniref:ABC transporter domain-containing protein n=1 Tax=Vagococcus vulneris TaxID=1977869 RepID=A0A429ZXQ9_9ENTE|nr:ABC transporter ATP-binding protein [Vagococcus vulneris]RST98615.1 hypothetical protein CBF37_07515 [Vagococcus vulneris]